jgi:hypothetical protein
MGRPGQFTLASLGDRFLIKFLVQHIVGKIKTSGKDYIFTTPYIHEKNIQLLSICVCQ